MAVVAEIDLESGDLSEFSATVTDGGDLSVTQAAALAGSDYGLQVTIDDTTSIYGYVNLGAPNTSGVVRYRFYVDINSISMQDGDLSEHSLVMITDLTANPISFLMLERTEGGQYAFYAVAVDDTGNHHNTQVYPVTDAPHYVEVLCTRASSSVAEDGGTTFWVDGVEAYSTILGVDNYDQFADWQLIIMGAPSGVDPTTSGTFYLDELIVRDDDTEIGPVQEPDPEPSPTGRRPGLLIPR